MLNAPTIGGFLEGDGFSGDGTTEVNTLALSETAVANSIISSFDGTSPLPTATADANGKWTFETGSLSEGPRDLTAMATDAAGNISATSAPLNVTVNAPEVDTQLLAAFAIMSSMTGAASPLIDTAADHLINADHSPLVALTVSGLAVVQTGTAFSGVSNHQLVTGSWISLANPPPLTNGAIASSPSVDPPADSSTSATGNAVSTDIDSGLNPTLSVNATNPADVIFTVSGLESDYSGTVTFTDTTGKSDVVPIGSDGTYSANLSNLTNGTLTYVMTVTDPAGNIITVDPTATLGDGSANAPAGTPQLPNLLNGYKDPPPWEVAGVDYAVGIPSGTVLKNPATISMAGVTVDTSNDTVYVTGNNVTLNGYDFSLNGGWEVYIEDGASNTLIENSNFLVGSNDQNPIQSTTDASNLTVVDCVFNGGGANEPNESALIYFQGSGTFVSEYNVFENTPEDAIDLNPASPSLTSTVSFNLFDDLGLEAGAHPDVVQFVGGVADNSIISYNTIYQPATNADGMEGIQIAAQLGGTVNNTTVANNTLIAAMGAASGDTMSFVIALLSGPSGPGNTINNTLVENNYIDPTGAYGTFYPLTYTGAPTNTTISNNVDMTTGDFIEANNSEVAPTTVTKVLASPSSGVETHGNTITLTVDFSAAVTVSGTPTLSLNDGGTATYTGGSGTSALTFSYTVAATDSSESALAITQVNLPNGATIDDTNGNTPNFTGAVTTFSGLQIGASSGPTLNSIAESPSSGDLNAGKTVTLTLSMSEVVTVNTTGGSPTLSLNDGGTATYVSGSGSSALVFSYTVAASQNTSDLAVTTVNLNGATIKDGSGNAANVSLTGLTQTGPQIDTTTPTISSITESPSSGDVTTGNSVTLTLNMSEVVTVASGTPTLTLNDGETATYVSGSGTSTLTFSYTVAAADKTSALAATAVNLNGAAIADLAGNAANLSLTGLTQTGPQINTTTPTISSITESPSSGDVTTGNSVTLTLGMNEAVTVNTSGGTPTLTLNDGETATYVSGSGTNALTFKYTVGAADAIAALAATAVNLNGATIVDGSGNAANLSLSGLTQTGPQINTPVGTWYNQSFPTQTTTFTASFDATPSQLGSDITVGLSPTAASAYTGMAAIVLFDSSNTIEVRDGSTYSADVSVPYTAGTTYQFSMVVDVATDTYSVYVTPQGGSQIALATNYSFRTEQATATSLSDLTEYTDAGAVSVSNFAISAGPSISSLAESPSSGDLDAGKTVTYTLTMNEVVTVNTTGGSPTLSLNDGGTATYVSGSGTSALTFSYTVLAGQNTPDLTVSAVNLNGGTIQDGTGNAANLSLTGIVQGSPEIDTTAPTVSSVTATAGDYDAGKVLTLTLNMSEAVDVTGTPTLTLNDGGTASYVSGSGSSALVFSYTVGAGQNIAALAVTGVTGTIADLAGNALSTAGLPETFTGVVVDTTTPTISAIAESPSSGDLNAGKTVTFTLTTTEAVTVNTTGGTPTLTLNDGSTATYSGGSGTTALTFSYTVGAGQNIAALAATAVNLNGGTIQDGAGNAASLSLTGLTQTGPQIDTTTPTISSLVESPSSGDLDAGKTVTLTLDTSEVVTVNTTGGSPTLSLNDGGTATYVSGSGTSTLTFSYTVGAGQNTSALAATAVNLNSATITDGAGNAANLSLTGLTQTGPKIDTTAPTVSSVTATAGDYDAGKVLTLTLNMSEAVDVTGTPTLTLNDGGTASYVSGSGSSALVFSYTVGAGQNIAALAVTGVTGTIADLAGNALSTAGLPETFTGVVVDTTTPTISAIAESPSSGDLNAGKTVTFTLTTTEAVTVNTTGGTPTLTLNDGSTATYSGGSGTTALTFSYTVGAGQNIAALAATAVNLNGGTIQDGAGNAASLSLTGLTQTGPQIDTTTPTISSLVESP